MKNTLVGLIVVGILAPAAFLLSNTTQQAVVTTIIPCPGTVIATSSTATSSFPCPPNIVVSVQAGYQPTDDELAESLAAAWVTLFGTGITDTPDNGGLASSTQGTLVIGEIETPIYISLPDFDINYELPYTGTSTGMIDPITMAAMASTTTSTASTTSTDLLNQLASLASTTTSTGTTTADDPTQIAEAELKLLMLKLELQVQELLKQIEEVTAYNVEIAKREATNNLICPDLPRNVFINDTGYDIRLLQVFLKDLGPQIYPEQSVTGFYDAATKAAVGNFQELVSLILPGQAGYGVTGPKTRGVIKNYCANAGNPIKYIAGQSYTPSTTQDDYTNYDVDAMTSAENNPIGETTTRYSSSGNYGSRYTYGTSSFGSLTSSGSTNSTGSSYTYGSSRTVPVSFDDSSIPLEVTPGQTFEVRWNGSSQYVELVTIEAYKDNVRHFFGSYVMQTGFANLTIPQDFAGKESLTLIINHKSQLKDSVDIIVK